MKPSIITIHLFFLFVGLFLGLALQAQPITNGGFTNATSGTLYDTGDSGGDYGPNENIVYTICPSNSNCVQLDFFSFSTELNSDILNIYDGPNWLVFGRYQYYFWYKWHYYGGKWLRYPRVYKQRQHTKQWVYCRLERLG